MHKIINILCKHKLRIPEARKGVAPMKIGLRKPSVKRSIKARTTSKWKRQAKREIIQGYGKKGMGWIKNPKKAAYNKIYRKTTFSVIPRSYGSDKSKRSVNSNGLLVGQGAIWWIFIGWWLWLFVMLFRFMWFVLKWTIFLPFTLNAKRKEKVSVLPDITSDL